MPIPNSYNFVCILYGCGTWSTTLKVEHRLRIFKNRALRRISGLKRNERI
jgi:hypothetical protein